MPRTGKRKVLWSFWAVLGACLFCAGCTAGREFVGPEGEKPPEPEQVAPPACAQATLGFTDRTVPRELEKVSLPPYVIEPPDILLVDAVRLIPRPPYKVEPLDALAIQVTNTLPNAPIAGIYAVDPSGAVNLGFTYGSVGLLGQTLDQVKASIEKQLKGKLNPPFEVAVALAESKAMQQVRG